MLHQVPLQTWIILFSSPNRILIFDYISIFNLNVECDANFHYFQEYDGYTEKFIYLIDVFMLFDFLFKSMSEICRSFLLMTTAMAMDREKIKKKNE